MNNVILISDEQLQQQINDAVAKALEKVEAPKAARRINLDLNEGIAYLNEIGYKCSHSLIYKLTMSNSMPFSKFGRRITFNADELDAWGKSKKQKSIDVSMAVSKCATSKLSRA